MTKPPSQAISVQFPIRAPVASGDPTPRVGWFWIREQWVAERDLQSQPCATRTRGDQPWEPFKPTCSEFLPSGVSLTPFEEIHPSHSFPFQCLSPWTSNCSVIISRHTYLCTNISSRTLYFSDCLNPVPLRVSLQIPAPWSIQAPFTPATHTRNTSPAVTNSHGSTDYKDTESPGLRRREKVEHSPRARWEHFTHTLHWWRVMECQTQGASASLLQSRAC